MSCQKEDERMSITKIARTVALEVDIEPDLFSAFMTKRFPNETDYCYIKEWALRFKSGNPVAYMDGTSKEIYFECCRAY